MYICNSQQGNKCLVPVQEQGTLSHDLRLDEKQEKLEVRKCFFYNELEVRKC
jgi:hypothetical protein